MFEDHIPHHTFDTVKPHTADVPIIIETAGRRVLLADNPSLVPFARACLRGATGEHDTPGYNTMSQTQGDTKTISFPCPAVGRTVRVLRDYKSLVSRTGQEWARVIWKRDCSDKDNCPVATHRGTSVSCDWSKCAFRKADPTKS